MRPHDVEYSLQICNVIVFSMALYYNIVHVVFYSLVYMLMEYCIHCSLICCPLILQAEGHHDVAIHPQWHSERCMLFIFRVHLDLIVSENLSMKDILSKSHVLLIITSMIEREFVFGTGSVQIMEVDASLDFFILLGDGHDVGYPVRVLFFPDETRVYELFNF